MPETQYAANLAKDLLKTFKEVMQDYPTLCQSVQGFSEFQTQEYANRSPIQVNHFFGDKFSREFNSLLQGVLNELRAVPHLDKKQFHLCLLEKYLGIKIEPDCRFIATTFCSAYHSLPDEDSDDCLLHNYYLQPFKLFSISNANRKFIRKEDPNNNRQWCWHEDLKSDIAPFLRKIIQLYILCYILQDYESTEDAYTNPIVAENIPHLKTLHAELLASLKPELTDFFLGFVQMTNPNAIQGDPKGLLDEAASQIETLSPGFVEMASFYPIGRLLLGQPSTESHHAIARFDANSVKDPKESVFKYASSFLYSHLNLSTSLFWIKVGVKNILNKWHTFKRYVTGESSNQALIQQASSFFHTMLLVVASPLLILAPPLYGLTTLPFTCLRLLCLQGPFKLLKHYNILKFLDIIELIKDLLILQTCAFPILMAAISSFNLLLPEIMLDIGGLGVYGMLVLADSFFYARPALYYAQANALLGLAMSEPARLFGASLIFGASTYLGAAYTCRLLHLLPFPLTKNEIANLFSPLTRFINNIELTLKNWLYASDLAMNLEIIIPEIFRKNNLSLPKLSVLRISDWTQSEIDQFNHKLGTLNQAFYLTPQRKAQIRKCIKDMDIDSESTEDSLNQALNRAAACLTLCLDKDETTQMLAIIEFLESKDKALTSVFSMEKLFIRQQQNIGLYQPSCKLLHVLADMGFIKEAKWAGPPHLKPMESLLGKCQRLKALETADQSLVPQAPVFTPAAQASKIYLVNRKVPNLGEEIEALPTKQVSLNL